MGFFSRGPKPFLPADASHRFDLYGRAEGPLGSGDPVPALELRGEMREGLQHDPTRCVEEVRDAAYRGGGWALYAAVDILNNLLESQCPEQLSGGAYQDVLDAAILFLRDEGYSSWDLTRAMQERWLDAEGPFFLYDNLRQTSVPAIGAEPAVDDLVAHERRELVRHQYEFDPGGIEEIAVEHAPSGRLRLTSRLDGRSGNCDTWRRTPEYDSLHDALRQLGAKIGADRGVLWLHDDVRPYLNLESAPYTPRVISQGK